MFGAVIVDGPQTEGLDFAAELQLITSCHVTVIAPTMKRRHGDLFKIDICVAMPNHKDILVSKAHGDAPEHEHVMVAIKDAFAAAQRQIKDAAREMRGQVKPQ